MQIARGYYKLVSEGRTRQTAKSIQGAHMAQTITLERRVLGLPIVDGTDMAGAAVDALALRSTARGVNWRRPRGRSVVRHEANQSMTVPLCTMRPHRPTPHRSVIGVWCNHAGTDGREDRFRPLCGPDENSGFSLPQNGGAHRERREGVWRATPANPLDPTNWDYSSPGHTGATAQTPVCNLMRRGDGPTRLAVSRITPPQLHPGDLIGAAQTGTRRRRQSTPAPSCPAPWSRHPATRHRESPHGGDRRAGPA
jgi:hypothetical protein